VLRAALEWAVQKNDGPERTDESEWRKELEAATKNPKQLGHIAGVTEDLAEHLRAFANVFGKDLIRELFDEADVEDVIVDRAKIIDYLLSETHENGRQKAAFFRRFGFRAENWQELADALKRHTAAHKVTSEKCPPFGSRFIFDGIMHMPDRRKPHVRSVWFLRTNETAPRFVTAYPLKRYQSEHDE
jgi:hypothetical protein